MECPPVTVLFGTQTGNAQEVAERIVREGKRRHLHIRAIDLEDYSIVSVIANAHGSNDDSHNFQTRK